MTLPMFTEAEKTFLESHNLCRVATASKRAEPHVVPVFYKFDGKYVYFGTGRMTSKKIRHLKENPRVSVLVDELVREPRGMRGIVIQGDVELDEAEDHVRVKVVPVKKSSWGIDH